jgi:hypothetical protein
LDRDLVIGALLQRLLPDVEAAPTVERGLHPRVGDFYTHGGLIMKRATVGARVTLEAIESGERREYTLVPAAKSDVTRGLISVASPVGKAVLQRAVGEEITVQLPKGQRSYEIVDIR